MLEEIRAIADIVGTGLTPSTKVQNIIFQSQLKRLQKFSLKTQFCVPALERLVRWV